MVVLAALVVLLPVLGALGYFSLIGVTLKETYTITTVQGATNISKRQVNSRLVSITVNQHTQAAQATGGSAPATQARGTLHFFSNTLASVHLQQGFIIDPVDFSLSCLAPVQMVLDTSVTLPPSPDLKQLNQAFAPAHVLQFGTIGNIPGQGDRRCFKHARTEWSAFNDTPFTGGQDAILQQSDIDRAAHNLLAANPTPNARRTLISLIESNERLLNTPAPSCKPRVTSNYAAGDKTGEALVNLSYLCTGYAYDYQGAAQIATRLLTERAASDLISFFKLNGQITAAVTSATLTTPQQATIRLIVVAQGTWVLRL